jgi:hypothetical protein
VGDLGAKAFAEDGASSPCLPALRWIGRHNAERSLGWQVEGLGHGPGQLSVSKGRMRDAARTALPVADTGTHQIDVSSTRGRLLFQPPVAGLIGVWGAYPSRSSSGAED